METNFDKPLEQDVENSYKNAFDVGGDRAVTSGSLNDIDPGTYRVTADALNIPVNEAGYVTCIIRGELVKTQMYITDSSVVYVRNCNSGNWGNWTGLTKKSDTDAVSARITTLENAKPPATVTGNPGKFDLGYINGVGFVLKVYIYSNGWKWMYTKLTDMPS